MILYQVVRFICYPFARLLFWIRIEGHENIPKKGPVIIASKHSNWSDPIFHAICVWRPLHTMAKTELFKGRFMNWLMRQAGAFPVRRGKADRSAIELAIEFVEEGKPVLIFPEGTRSRTTTEEFKSGAVMVAAATGAPIVPATIVAKRGYVLFGGMTLRYGKPVTPEELGAQRGNSAALRDASEKLRELVMGLAQQTDAENKTT